MLLILPHGAWTARFDGYGSARVVSDPVLGQAIQLRPRASAGPGETHAALVTSTAQFGDFTAHVRMRTVKQLRSGSPPNPWETGWLLWDYRDNRHFYYVSLKPTGWEIGKEDPRYPGDQRFLASGTDRRFPLGRAYALTIHQSGGAFEIAVDGTTLARVRDTQSPYRFGELGLYCEDAAARFGAVDVTAEVLR